MFSSKTLVLLGLLAPFTLAQYGGGPGPAPVAKTTTTPVAGAVAASTSTSASASATQTIIAGMGGLMDLSFTPPTVQAAAGTFVEFQFNANNHSVAGSALSAPCQPANGSFFAGFGFSALSGPASNSFVLNITGTEPIYFYCPQILQGFKHCALGMVGIINPPTPQTQAQFVANAMAPNVSVIMPTVVAGGSVVSNTTTASTAPSATPTSAANHLTFGMSLMGLIGIGFSALLSF